MATVRDLNFTASHFQLKIVRYTKKNNLGGKFYLLKGSVCDVEGVACSRAHSERQVTCRRGENITTESNKVQIQQQCNSGRSRANTC